MEYDTDMGTYINIGNAGFQSARNSEYNIIHRELATGKGFADLVMIPRRNVSSPAIILELKYNQDADAAIDQILRKQYPAKVAPYTGELLLVGISYDKKEKTHQCHIIRINKDIDITKDKR